MKVLGIAGSPRKNGNTDLLLKEVLTGASSAGGQTRLIRLAEYDVGPCRHCDGCLKTGECIVQDDMQWIISDLRNADRIVMASPVFFMGLSAQIKAMIDRCQCLWVMNDLLGLPIATNCHGERKGLFLSAGGTGYPGLFQPSLATIKAVYRVLDVEMVGELTFRDIDEKGAIVNHPTAITDAFAAGVDLVKP
ncbi:MAG: flavodoxin family protein [Chloroflexota bacterium]|nr:flavodoxin family protein [Chloroflexota bacterium]